MKNNHHAFATRAIHHGYDAQTHQGALVPPVYMTSTFEFESVEQGAARFAGEETGHFYSRISNPTQQLLEERIADLEETEAALATASGMGAISATIWTLVSAGDHIIADKTLYGCTFALLKQGLARFNVDVSFVDCTQPAEVAGALTPRTRVLYFETPVNPNMRIMDIRALSRLAHDYNPDLKVVVDNTYCTPALQQPLTLGADLVVHSATKYLGGHGDLVAGVVAGKQALIDEIRLVGLKDLTGAVIAPMTAFLIMRGLKTLSLRMERHCQTAATLAQMLSEEDCVEQVYYPGLSSHSGHQLASKQMKLPGGMIAFELKGGLPAGIRFMNRLQLIRRAVSLGDAETLCQHPASMTHSTYSPQERQTHGISEGLIRLSAGLEDVDDLIADLRQALTSL